MRPPPGRDCRGRRRRRERSPSSCRAYPAAGTDSGLCQPRQVAGYPGAAAIAHDALPAGRVSIEAARAATAAPVGLATIDDHSHVLAVFVVLHQLRVELVGEGFWDHAV